VAVGFDTGGDWTYFESVQKKLKPGWNKDVSFNLTKAEFKARESGWRYVIPLGHPEEVRRVFILIYKTLRMRNENICIDNIRFKYREKLVEINSWFNFLGNTAFAQELSSPPQPPSPQVLKTSPEILKVSAVKGSVSQGEKFELAVELRADFENPFDPQEINLYAELLSPTGKKIIMPGFLYSAAIDGESKEVKEPQWRIRFTPTEKGQWGYKVCLKTPKGGDETEVKTFQCDGALKKGFVRVSRIDPLYFEFDNGEFYYPVGENISWAKLSGFEKYFSEMHKVGGNWSRVWMANWEVALEWTGKGYHGLGLYNLKKAEKLDKILDIAAKNDIYIQLVINHHGQLSTKVNPQWKENPYNAKNGGPCEKPLDFFTNQEARRLFKNRLRYIVARWGYSPNILAWELWNELTFVDDLDLEIDYVWHKEMSEYLKKIDPLRHMVTTSYAGTIYNYSLNAKVWRLKTIDFTQFHMYTPDIVELAGAAYRLMSSFDKPYFLAEFGRGTEDGVDMEDPEGTNLHAGLWAQFMTPSAGNAMPWWWDCYIHPKRLYYHWQALTKFAGNLDRRLKNYKFDIAKTKGRVNQEELSVYIQGFLDNREAMLWIFDLEQTKFNPPQKEAFSIEGVPVRLEGMCPGTYLIEFWNTYTGEVIEARKKISPKGDIEFTVPAFKKDVAVKVRLVEFISLNHGEPDIVDIVPQAAKTSFNKIVARRAKNKIKIDADLSDWSIENLPLEYKGVIGPQVYSHVNKGQIDSEGDCSAAFYVSFDDKFIYFAAHVLDDSVVGQEKGIDIWRDDCVEVWIDTSNIPGELNNIPFNCACYQINLAPLTENKAVASVYAYRNFNTPPVTQGTRVSSKIVKDGYIIEAAIPIESLYGLDLSKATIIGFNVSLVDRDKIEDKWSHIIWSGSKEDDATGWGNLQFED